MSAGLILFVAGVVVLAVSKEVLTLIYLTIISTFGIVRLVQKIDESGKTL